MSWQRARTAQAAGGVHDVLPDGGEQLVAAHGGGVVEGDLVAAVADAVEVAEAAERLAPRRLGRVPLGGELLREHVDVERDLVIDQGVDVALRARQAEVPAEAGEAGHGLTRDLAARRRSGAAVRHPTASTLLTAAE